MYTNLAWRRRSTQGAGPSSGRAGRVRAGMLTTFVSECEMDVVWCKTSSPSTLSRDPLAISNMAVAKDGRSSSALLSLGQMQCVLCGERTPVLHVRGGVDEPQTPDDLIDVGGAFDAFVFPADGDMLCVALTRETTAEQFDSLLRCLNRHATVLEALERDGTPLPSLHSPFWAPDAEKVIATGAEALAGAAIELMPAAED